MSEHAAPVQAVQAPAPQLPANGFQLQRKCACGSYSGGGECDKCRDEKTKLQRAAASGAKPNGLPSIVYDVLNSSGHPLDADARAWMEPRFNHDFSGVRVHTDERAAQSAREVNALAYTVGRDVVFGAGHYAPGTERGSRLLAHELTHVVQQTRAGSSAQAKAVSDPSDAAELEADAMADRVMSGESARVTQAPSATLHAARGDTETALGVVFGAISAGIVGLSIAAIAGAFDREKFSDDELVEYLTVLATTHHIEGTSASDNKARNVVSRWSAPTKFDVDKGFSTGKVSLTAIELKRLLILEMIEGPTGESDQLAIIAIFSKSKPDDVEKLLDPTGGLSLQDLESEMSKENLSKLLGVLNQKLPDIGKPQVKRSETAQTGECSAGRAIKISFAHQRAEDAVRHTIRLLDEFIAKPDGNKAVEAQLICYFNNPTADQVKQIRSDFQGMSETLSKITYTCPAEPFTGYNVRSSEGVSSFEPEKDLWMRSAVDLAEGEKRTFQNMVFPDFFGLNPQVQTRACVHESFHHLKRHGSKAPDEYEPPCGSLATDFAMNNADSYAQFAMALESVNPSAAVGGQQKPVQRKASDDDTADEVPDVVDDALHTPGRPLEAATRARMEPRFNRDFSQVRVHADSSAAQSARAVNAHAYTVGQDVVFGAGQYDPGTEKGARLLAHELTHVVQQSESGPTATQTAKPISEPDDAAEVEADSVAEEVLSGDAAVEVNQSPTAAVHAELSSEAIGGLVAGGIALGGVAAGFIVAAAIGAFDTSRFRKCTKDQQDVINAATNVAQQWIDNAVAKVDGVLANPEKPDESVKNQLNLHFKITPDDKDHLNRLRQGLGQIQAGFGQLLFECNPSCPESGTGAGAGEVPGLLWGITLKYGRIHVCPRFFREAQDPADRRENEKAETIAHEMAHRFIGARGDVYRNPAEPDRYAQKYKDLTTEEALENADSYAQFAKTLFNITGTQPPKGDTKSAPAAKPAQRKAIGPDGPRVTPVRRMLQRQPAPETTPTPTTTPTEITTPAPKPTEETPRAKEPEVPVQTGGIPKLDPTSGMSGHPAPPDCLDFLWAREYERIFRLDTISIVGLSARPASEKKEDLKAAAVKNAEFQGALAEVCANYINVKHPFRVRFYYLDTNLRNTLGERVKTEDAERNYDLGIKLGADQTNRVHIYLERDLESQDSFADAKSLDEKIKKTIEHHRRSAARRGATTGLIVGSILGGLTAIGVGLGVGFSLADAGKGTEASLGYGALAGALAGGAVLGASAGVGALIGYAGGTDRGTEELSKDRIKEVKTFVAVLRKAGEVTGDTLTNNEADNLARDAVTLWIDNPSELPLTIKDRRLLIKVMMDGPTLDDDERAIIRLIENCTDAEVLDLLDPTVSEKERVTVQMLDSEIHGEEWKQTRQMLQSRFPTLGQPGIERTKTQTEPPCEADQAIMVLAARKRATEVVPIALQRITDYLGDPSKQQAVLSKINCYFPSATTADVERIKGVFETIQQLIPSSRYVCAGKGQLTIQTPRGPAQEACTSGDVAYTVTWPEPDGTYKAHKETYLCPTFFENGPVYQATTLIHEWVHRVMPESGTDTYDPKCADVKLATALVNPDSYALLARDLAEGRVADVSAQPSVTIGNFRNTGAVTPENRCESCAQIPSLGVDPTRGANFMELRGDISGHRPDALYDFKRTKEVAIWMHLNGAWESQDYSPPGTLDDNSWADEDVAPKDNRIYSIDGPGGHMPIPAPVPPQVEGGVYKGNFVESVNVKVGQGPWTQSSNLFEWHSITTFERGADGIMRRTAKNNEIEPGHIPIGPAPPGP